MSTYSGSNPRSQPGRKVVRTVTAPTIITPNIRQTLFPSSSIDQRPDWSHQSLSGSQREMPTSLTSLSSTSPRSGASTPIRRELCANYSLKQQLKDTLVSIQPAPGSSSITPVKRHRREVVRCWSRERVIRNESILSVRPPPGKSSEANLTAWPSSSSNVLGSPSPSLLERRSPSNFSTCSQSIGSVHSLFSSSMSPSRLGKRIPVKVDRSTGPMEWSELDESVQTTSRVQSSATQTDHPQTTDAGVQPVSTLVVDSNDTFKEADSPVTTSPSSTKPPVKSLTIDTSIASILIIDQQDNLHQRSASEPDLSSCDSSSNYTTASSGGEESIMEQHVDEDRDNDQGQSPTNDPDLDMCMAELDHLVNSFNQPQLDDSDSDEDDESDQNGGDWQYFTFRATVQRDQMGYGFRVCNQHPVCIHHVRQGGVADIAGIRLGDEIIKINGQLVEDSTHYDVVSYIRDKPTVRLLLRRKRPYSSRSLDRVDSIKFYQSTTLASPNRSTISGTRTSLSRDATGSLTSPGGQQPSPNATRYNQRRRSQIDSLPRGSAIATAIKRRARHINSIESAFNDHDGATSSLLTPLSHPTAPPPTSPPGLSRSFPDLTSPFIHDSQAVNDDDVFELDSQQQNHEQDSFDASNLRDETDEEPSSLPPKSTSRLMRFRSNFNKSMRNLKDRPLSLGPESLAKVRRSSTKESPTFLSPNSSDPILFSNTRLPVSERSRNIMLNNNNVSLQSSTISAPIEESPKTFSRDLAVLSENFKDASLVLSSPARLGLFLRSLFLHNRDPAPTPLRLVDLPPILVESICNKIAKNGHCESLFDSLATHALKIVQMQVEKMARGIESGLETFGQPEGINLRNLRSRDDELHCFERLLTPYLTEWCKRLSTSGGGKASTSSLSNAPPSSDPSSGGLQRRVSFSNTNPFLRLADDQCRALALSLVTIHRHFTLDTAWNAFSIGPKLSPSKGSRRPLGANIGTRSTENLHAASMMNINNVVASSIVNTTVDIGISSNIGRQSSSVSVNLNAIGSALWTKLPYFCAKPKAKAVHLFSNRKTKKGHSLHEGAIYRICNCSVCNKLLWGLAPQGWLCANCDLSVHNTCRSKIAASCNKEGRRSLLATSLGSSDSNLTLPPACSSTDLSVVSTNGTTPVDNTTPTFDSAPSNESVVTSPSSAAVNLSRSNSDRQVDSASSIETSSPTADSVASHLNKPLNEVGDSGPSSSTLSIISRGSVSRTSPSVCGSELVSDLVTTDWSNDSEMNAGESIDPDVDLRNHFPEYKLPQNPSKNENHVRLMVLLEFHQKIQYMIRYLKMYEYLLLNHWPVKHERLKYDLSLDRIPPIIELFRSLVNCIEQTKTPQTYGAMAEAVLDWFTRDSETNLILWASNCQALSGTNTLDTVRQYVEIYKNKNPDIVPLLETRHNKTVLLDGLRQLRTLWFNLPTISRKIVDDLSRKTKSFKAEAKVWKEINKILENLPKTLNEMAMPLAEWINSGQLTSVVDKKESFGKFQNDVMATFTRTLFHYWVIAHAEVTVEGVTIGHRNYLKERTEMLAILLQNALILLVKEGDRFVLRPLKPPREHAVTANIERPATASSASPSTTGAVSALVRTNPLSSASFSTNPSLSSSSQQRLIAGGSVDVMSSSVSLNHRKPTRPPPSKDLFNQVISSGHKLAPVFQLKGIHTSLGEKSGPGHLLNFLTSVDPPILVQLLFREKQKRQTWYDLIKKYATEKLIAINPVVRCPSDVVESEKNADDEESPTSNEEETRLPAPSPPIPKMRMHRIQRRHSEPCEDSLVRYQMILVQMSDLAEEARHLIANDFQQNNDYDVDQTSGLPKPVSANDYTRLCQSTMGVVGRIIPLLIQSLNTTTTVDDQSSTPRSSISSPTANSRLTVISLPDYPHQAESLCRKDSLSRISSPNLYRSGSDSRTRPRRQSLIKPVDRRKVCQPERSDSTSSIDPLPVQMNALVVKLQELQTQLQQINSPNRPVSSVSSCFDTCEPVDQPVPSDHSLDSDSDSHRRRSPSPGSSSSSSNETTRGSLLADGVPSPIDSPPSCDTLFHSGSYLQEAQSHDNDDPDSSEPIDTTEASLDNPTNDGELLNAFDNMRDSGSVMPVVDEEETASVVGVADQQLPVDSLADDATSDYQTENMGDPSLASSSSSANVNRNDSQKSTASSGFVEMTEQDCPN